MVLQKKRRQLKKDGRLRRSRSGLFNSKNNKYSYEHKTRQAAAEPALLLCS